jgi:hypothetical protein
MLETTLGEIRALAENSDSNYCRSPKHQISHRAIAKPRQRPQLF